MKPLTVITLLLVMGSFPSCQKKTSPEARSDLVSKSKDRSAELLKGFSTEKPKLLEAPYVGKIRAVYPKDIQTGGLEEVKLNMLLPAEGRKRSLEAVPSPCLASTNDGISFSGAFYALRNRLPTTAALTSVSNYKGLVSLLGEPTHLPFSGETDEQWAYDTVSWLLFTPIDSDTIEVIYISVARKSQLDKAESDDFIIESYSVERGKLIKSEQVAASDR